MQIYFANIFCQHISRTHNTYLSQIFIFRVKILGINVTRTYMLYNYTKKNNQKK